jgi:hypothetical protein
MEDNPNPEGIAVTQDEIIEMAKLAGWEMDDSCVLSPQVLWYIYQGQLETFAKLVAAKEREACAKIADEWAVGWPHPSQSIAEWIRKRT